MTLRDSEEDRWRKDAVWINVHSSATAGGSLPTH